MKTAQRGRTRALPSASELATTNTGITVGQLVELVARTIPLPDLTPGVTTGRPLHAYVVLPGARVRVNDQANERKSGQDHGTAVLLITRRATEPVCIDLSLT